MTFSPLPCCKDLPPEVYRERVGKMAVEIEEDAAAARKRRGVEPFGAAKILAQDPWTRPERVWLHAQTELNLDSLFDAPDIVLR